eukprot:GCRY01002299.1.p1 GENE.GCRY01002299.1~~GCRY01002299.1.p1  ORF type:complete len:259 (-),score=30.21 GCRY01002299.1:143-862(-)
MREIRMTFCFVFFSFLLAFGCDGSILQNHSNEVVFPGTIIAGNVSADNIAHLTESLQSLVNTVKDIDTKLTLHANKIEDIETTLNTHDKLLMDLLCPDGYFWNFSCYLVSEGMHTSPQARDWCESQNAELFLWSSKAEYDFVAELLNTTALSSQTVFWVDLHDAHYNHTYVSYQDDSVVLWSGGGPSGYSPVGLYFFWLGNEPSSVDEECVHIWLHSLGTGLNDRPCTWTGGAVCKRRL